MEQAVIKKELRVLMLEDTPTDAELMEHELRRANIVFTSKRVETRDVFVRALEEFHPDIVLSDYKLPDFDGMEALKIVRRDYPHVPVIMVTGALIDIEAVELIHAGARDYILKDRLARLGPAVQRALSAEQGIRARKMAEEKFRKISESAQDAIIMMGADQRISFWNTAAERIFGYTAAEAMGQELHTLLAPPRMHAAFAHGHTHFLQSGEGPVIGKLLELTALRKGGAEFPLELTVSAAQLNGEWHAIGIARDISQRKQMEQTVIENERKFRTLFETANDGIFLLDATGFVDCNQRGADLYGLAKEGIIRHSPDEFCLERQPDGRLSAEVAAEKNQAAMRGESTNFEWRAMRADNTTFDVDISLNRIEFGGAVYLQAVVRDITERKQAEIALRHANRALATLGAVNRQLVHATDENDLLQAICQAIVEQRGYRMAWVGYAQPDENRSVKVMASAGHEDGYLDTINITWAETERGMGPTGRAIRSGTTQLCQDFLNDPRHLPWLAVAQQRGYAASIALPLTKGVDVYGALTVYSDEINTFTPNEVALLEEMAGDLAFGVSALHIRHERDSALEKNRQQLTQLQDSLEDTVRAIAAIVEMRDPYTAGHQNRVADLAAAIARQMGLPDELVHAIHLAGAVHDLGKIQIPSEILSKPGKISNIEFSLIKTHAQAGYDILNGIRFPWPIAQMVWQHHERHDGSGYPQGLKGEDILLEARILAVADVVEAMYSHRPYRPGLGIEAALDEITRARGTRYDPQVVDACVALFREQGYSLAV